MLCYIYLYVVSIKCYLKILKAIQFAFCLRSSDAVIFKFFICFSLVKNTKAVMNTNAPDGAILSINGIRTISMMWVILGHCYLYGELRNVVGK